MKVLLINPPINYEKYGKFGKLLDPVPPIGLAYIAGMLSKNGIEVNVIDEFVSHLSIANILNYIKETNTNIVGIPCLTPTCKIVYEFARRIKQMDKNIFIILGNIHASYFAEEILMNEPVDLIIHGEAEYKIVEVVNAIRDRSNFNKISGITFKKDNNIVSNYEINLIEDLDELPYPEWGLFPYNKYRLIPFINVRKPALVMLLSRGCIYNCKFCCLKFISKKYRKRVPEKIIDEMKYLTDRYKVKQIGFVDATFPLDRTHATKICNRIIEERLNKKIEWVCEPRIDTVDEELLFLMKKAGCIRVIFGFESANQLLLNNINKGFNIDIAQKVVNDSKKAGLEVFGFFMFGLPAETKEQIIQTIEFAKKLNIDYAKFAIMVPLPGSKLYEELKDKLKDKEFEDFTTYNPDEERIVYVEDKISKKELIYFQTRAHIEFYLRLKIIIKYLLKLPRIQLKDLFHTFSILISYFILSVASLGIKKRGQSQN